MEESQNAGADYVGTEHLLLGIIREEEGVAVRILDGLGLSPETIREAVMENAGGSAEEEESSHEPEYNEDPTLTRPDFSRKVKTKTPLLDEYARDLTALAVKGELDPVIGRDEEIERIIQILARRTKTTPF